MSGKSSTSGPPDRSTAYRRGYSNPSQLREAVAAAHVTKLGRTVSAAAADHLSVPAIIVLTAMLPIQNAPMALTVPLAALAALAVGRQLRALECLVHEASHFNWSRQHRRLNDVLATLLAAVPTGAVLRAYRESHLRHHGRFGTTDDPDRERYEALALEDIDRTRLGSFATGLARRFLAYQRGWLDSLGASPVIGVMPVLWAGGTIALPAWWLGGVPGLLVASATWLVAHLIALPLVRFVGESSEHIYRDTETVFAATVSNLGLLQRLLFHPHGDGYHTVHHMWPGVPHHQIAQLHQRLVSADPAFAAELRYRTRVLTAPTRGVTSAAHTPMPGPSLGRVAL